MAKKKAAKQVVKTTELKHQPDSTKTYYFTLQNLADTVGMKLMSVYQQKKRGNFDPENLLSVVFWVCHNAPDSVRQDLARATFGEKPKPEQWNKKLRRK